MTNAQRNERRRAAYAERKEREREAHTTNTLDRAAALATRRAAGARYRRGVTALREQDAAAAAGAAAQRAEFADVIQPVVTPGTYNEFADVPDGMPPRQPVSAEWLQQNARESAQRIIDAMNALDVGARRRTVDDVLRERATAILAEAAEQRARNEVFLAERQLREAANIKLLPTFISNELIETAQAAGKQWECIICATEKCPSVYKFRACGHRQCGGCFIKCGSKCPECRQ